jgi:hypothetical protein
LNIKIKQRHHTYQEDNLELCIIVYCAGVVIYVYTRKDPNVDGIFLLELATYHNHSSYLKRHADGERRILMGYE